MRRLMLSALAINAGISHAAIIDSPDYVARKSRAITVTSIERNDTATRMNVHIEYRPHFWVEIDSTCCLVDPATGIKYCPTAGEGFVFNEHYWMPDEGEADFAIVYPPIPEGVKSVDLDAEDWSIFGLRLDGERLTAPGRVDPAKWVAERDKPYPGVPPLLSAGGESRIAGRINGYDTRTGIENFQIYVDNCITGESEPVSVEVNDDGSFEKTIKLSTPGHVNISLGQCGLVPVYLEPGRDLDILLDHEEMLGRYSDRMMNRPLRTPITGFGGELGTINRELSNAPHPKVEWIGDIYRTMTPSEAAAQIGEWSEDYSSDIDRYMKETELHPHTKTLLDVNRKMYEAKSLLDYETNLRNVAYEDSFAVSLSEPLTPEFFAPLKKLFAGDDHWVLAGDGMSMLANRISFSRLFAISGLPYLNEVHISSDRGLIFLKENGAEFTPKEEECLKFVTDNLGKQVYLTTEEMMRYQSVNVKEIAERNGLAEEFAEYLKTQEVPGQVNGGYHNVVFNDGRKSQFMKEFVGTDDVPFIWQASLSCQICSWSDIESTDSPREELDGYLDALEATGTITDMYILGAMRDYFARLYNDSAYELPDDERGKVMKDIIAPYKGKYVLVDFWSTGCGPCRANIEKSADIRKANLDNADFKIVFVTSDGESPKGAYDKYVAEHLVGEASHRIPAADLNRLRDLFSFNGIPHYVLFDREGKVVSKRFSYYNLGRSLEKYGVKLN